MYTFLLPWTFIEQGLVSVSVSFYLQVLTSIEAINVFNSTQTVLKCWVIASYYRVIIVQQASMSTAKHQFRYFTISSKILWMCPETIVACLLKYHIHTQEDQKSTAASLLSRSIVGNSHNRNQPYCWTTVDTLACTDGDWIILEPDRTVITRARDLIWGFCVVLGKSGSEQTQCNTATHGKYPRLGSYIQAVCVAR